MANDRPSIWRKMRNWIVAAGKLKSLWQYLLFVILAGVFWLVMALNDQAQSDFTVKVEITGVPDSVTFISNPPTQFNVTVRDKGTLLFRRKFMEQPIVRISFSEFTSSNKLRVSSSAVMSRLRAIFGTDASINVTSVDSISVEYTTSPGKVVPIRVDADVTAALGKVVNGSPKLNISKATLYSVGNLVDTVTYVTTMPVVRRNLSDPCKLNVAIRPIKGVRIEPATVEVTIPVEPLENRKVMVPIEAVGVPDNESVSFFPQKVEVTYLVPMSAREDIPVSDFKVVADYTDVAASASDKVNIKILSLPKAVSSATVSHDSVEYTIIRNVSY
ncbi:MAG: hypothetical protein NC402_04195 [Prevotella sp.]|nr:hypothetical protein [Prevotella sp.]MCM1074196.1 hypothetical protein [Ruminococcus sp.]